MRRARIESAPFRALAIGWDVGGWLGKKQAVAVVGVRAEGRFGAPRVAARPLRLAEAVKRAGRA